MIWHTIGAISMPIRRSWLRGMKNVRLQSLLHSQNAPVLSIKEPAIKEADSGL